MALGDNGKLKLLYMQKLFRDRTDRNSSVDMQGIISYLAENDVKVTRQTVYDDLERLRDYGMDIREVKKGRYALIDREFSLAELKILVDSVQACKFISEEQSLDLIKKIESLTSANQAKELHRQVFVKNRIKHENALVLNNVDTVSAAINGDCNVRFRYISYTPDKKRAYRHGGAFYEVSPFALIWDDENYYLLARDTKDGAFKHYRVDKMDSVLPARSRREGREEFEKIDMSAYTKQVFGMFGGEIKKVRMRFANRLLDAAIDILGSGIMVIPDGGEHFTVTTEIAVSSHFFGWITSLGEGADIVWPEDVREEYKKLLETKLKQL